MQHIVIFRNIHNPLGAGQAEQHHFSNFYSVYIVLNG